MLKLFEKYKTSGKISEALLVIQNLFNKHPENEDVFDAYFSYLCELAELLPLYTDKQKFGEQANIALAFYKENANLDEIKVDHISNYQHRIEKINAEIDFLKKEKDRELLNEIRMKNDNHLKELFRLKEKLVSVSSEEEFNAVLVEISEIDELVDKTVFSKDQNSTYDLLTRDHSNIITSKMQEIEYKKNINYNRNAVEAFAKAFNLFKESEEKYKNHTQLYNLVSTTLFAYTSSRLFNETLIYYNHVYSYIFSKLDEDGKLTLTRYSIECERR